MLERLHQPPEPTQGPAIWRLEEARQRCPELQGLRTRSGVWRRLKRWKISWKCGRLHLQSPDPLYEAKLEAMTQARREAAAHPEAVRLVYVDEASFYRLPHPGRTWGAQQGGGRHQPRASHTAGANTKRRIVAALDAHSGEVCSLTRKVLGRAALGSFLAQLRRWVGAHVRLVLVWDNWPVHLHPDVLAAAQAQQIEVLYTPTYAPWTNPVEKLWKKLRHDVLHLHRWSHAWSELRRQVEVYLAALQHPNPDLLRYVGLTPSPI